MTPSHLPGTGRGRANLTCLLKDAGFVFCNHMLWLSENKEGDARDAWTAHISINVGKVLTMILPRQRCHNQELLSNQLPGPRQPHTLPKPRKGGKPHMSKLYSYCVSVCLLLVFTALPASAGITLTISTDRAVYNPGQTVKTTVIAAYANGKAVTGTKKTSVTIVDPSGVVRRTASLSNKGNGVFFYSDILPSGAAAGAWRVRASITDNLGDSASNNTVLTIVLPDKIPPVVTLQPGAGRFTGSVTVSMSTNEPATIYYTTNNTQATKSSSVYSTPLKFNTTTTLRYIAVDSAGNASATKVAVYTIPLDKTPPVVTPQPGAGGFINAVTVTMTANEPASIYYTTDNTPATSASIPYSAPLVFDSTTTLRFIAVDSTGNIGAEKTAVYSVTSGSGSSHAGLTYATTKCSSCHPTQTQAVLGNSHYQWNGPAGETISAGKKSGKNNLALNAYCINIIGNWNGCSKCHVGKGAKPGASPSSAEYDNIDCLTCHQEKYKRVRSGSVFVPDPTMTISPDQAVRTVDLPTRNACLSCHALGGGGDNNKRGDLALAGGATTDRNFDVHMATTGADLSCQACHSTGKHAMKGRGSDLHTADVSGRVGCATAVCHAAKTKSSGHKTSMINRHIARVACQTCHIPVYAKNANDTAATEATEIHRDWQESHLTASRQYHPFMTMRNDLTPVYRFWNGTSAVTRLGDPAVKDANGLYPVSYPKGGINDTTSKLYPFKYKTARQPLNTLRNVLIGLDTAVYFAKGNMYDAVQSGFVNMGFTTGEPYQMVTTYEYQALNHQVGPATSALTCVNCHGGTAKIKLASLGYTLKANQSTLCVSCHEHEDLLSFTKVHEKHVDGKKFDCSHCHNFSRPERGLR